MWDSPLYVGLSPLCGTLPSVGLSNLCGTLPSMWDSPLYVGLSNLCGTLPSIWDSPLYIALTPLYGTLLDFIIYYYYYYYYFHRDALLCSILDGVRATGNKDVCIKMRRTKLGLRLGPLLLPVEEEVESIFLKGIASSTAGPVFYNALEEFNVNIGYSGLNHAVTQEGLFTENKEKLINQAISSLLAKEGNQVSVLPVELEGQFHALRRLVASKAGYESFTSLPRSLS